MASVSMVAPSSSNNNASLAYPSTSYYTFAQYGQHGLGTSERYYTQSGGHHSGRYPTFGQFSGLEYNQLDNTGTSNRDAIAFSSHGNPPQYGFPLYSAYYHPPASLASDVVASKNSRTVTKMPIMSSGGGTTWVDLPPYHAIGPRHYTMSATGAHRQGVDAPVVRTNRGRSRVPPSTQWTSSESDAEIYHSLKSTQVVLHQQEDTTGVGKDEQTGEGHGTVEEATAIRVETGGEGAGGDSDSCSCGHLSSSNVDCSNRSTIGSSDIPSDVSSFDSNIYRCRTPEETGHTQNEGKGPPSPKLPPTHLKPACVSGRIRTRTHSSHYKRKIDLQGAFLRHSCHGDSFKHGSVEAMLPPPLKSKLKQPKKMENIHPTVLSSDNSISSIDTTGMSPIVSDWCPSSGSESNDQLCSNGMCDLCQQKIIQSPNDQQLAAAVAAPASSSSKAHVTQTSNSKRTIFNHQSSCKCYNDDTNECREFLPKSAIVCNHKDKPKPNIPREPTTSASTKDQELSIQPCQTQGHDFSRVHGKRQGKGSPSKLKSSGKVVCSVSNTGEGPALERHALELAHGCRTCASLRTSLDMARQSMIHGELETRNRTTTHGPGRGIRLGTKGLSTLAHVSRRHQRTRGSDTTPQDSVPRCQSVVVYKEPEG